MIHLRLIVSASDVAGVVEHLRSRPGVAHVVHLADASCSPPGHLVLCDVAREAANDVIEWLQDRGVHRGGALVIEAIEAVVSDAAAEAERAAPGAGGDAVIWEAIEDRAREESRTTASFLVFLAVATVIAGVGILLDSPILIVGAMVVGPEYGPLAAFVVAAVRRRWGRAGQAAATLGIGLAVGAATGLAATLLFRLVGLAPDAYDLSDRELTAFISHPDGMAAVIAVLAGIVGMLALTESRSGSLIGVLVSVTTIPAVANIGVAAAYGEWRELGGATLQLAINVAGLLVAGAATLVVQSRLTTRRALRQSQGSKRPSNSSFPPVTRP